MESWCLKALRRLKKQGPTELARIASRKKSWATIAHQYQDDEAGGDRGGAFGGSNNQEDGEGFANEEDGIAARMENMERMRR